MKTNGWLQWLEIVWPSGFEGSSIAKALIETSNNFIGISWKRIEPEKLFGNLFWGNLFRGVLRPLSPIWINLACLFNPMVFQAHFRGGVLCRPWIRIAACYSVGIRSCPTSTPRRLAFYWRSGLKNGNSWSLFWGKNIATFNGLQWTCSAACELYQFSHEIFSVQDLGWHRSKDPADWNCPEVRRSKRLQTTTENSSKILGHIIPKKDCRVHPLIGSLHL